MIKKVKQFIKKTFKLVDIVENINLDLLQQEQKKCLISYFTNSLRNDIDTSPQYVTNILEVNQIIKTFIDLNYCIDVTFCLDDLAYEKIKNKKYDVIFGFGDVFYHMCQLHTNAKKILYMTEHHPEFSKQKEKQRIEYFFKRHNKKVPLSRSGKYYKIEHFKNIKDMIILGEIFPYSSNQHSLYRINPTGLFNERYLYNNRNLSVSKKNFLWFGSNGAIHKGLDLLVDIFSKRDDWTLHICGLNKDDKKLLNFSNQKNIHDYGKINVQSDLFLELANKCSFVFLPSCSEAMSTSVLTCMRHSMIPIVLKDAGFNKLGEMAFFLNDYNLSYIEKRIDEIIEMDDSKIIKMHKRIFTYANQEFILEKFTADFKKIMLNIIDN